MAAPKRTPIEIEDHRRQISGYYLRGLTQAEIGKRLDLTQQMVSYDLKAIQEQWRKNTTINLDEAKLKELARIDALERTYWAAWESSLAEKETDSTERREGATSVSTKASIKKEQRDGNPAFLEGVMNCIKERSKLLGLYAAVKTESDVSLRVRRGATDLSQATDAELDAIIESGQAIQEARGIVNGN
ncbi:MAG: hypothetical protein ACE5Q6_05315 [Dehalococcoidia bacterium]